jgi:GT2 family glycosyltransferase
VREAAQRLGEAPDSRISILIVNWNTRELVLKCLDSLPDNVSGVPIEVIVVDNGSVDGSGDALERRRDITLIRNSRNRGFAAAVNQAYRRSAGEFVLLLNSDVELTADTLSSLSQFLMENPDAAAVAPLYINPDGSPQPFHFRFPTFAMTLANGSGIVRRLFPRSAQLLREYRMLDDDFSQPRPVPQPSASCLLLRRTLLAGDDHIFDERYPIFFNDVQLARSLAKRGLTLWVTPDATVIHEAHSSTRMLGPSGKRQYLGSVIRMLGETESPAKVWLYRSVVFLQHIPMWLMGRSDTIGIRALWKALSGDVGPLPSPQLEVEATSEARSSRARQTAGKL